jgi:hypothetical protein
MLTSCGDRNIVFKFRHELLEDISDDEKWDVVLCEGLLPLQLDPVTMFESLFAKVAKGGILVVTCADAVSYLGDVLRRLVAHVLMKDKSFDSIYEQVEFLLPFFSGHLNNLKGMSRPHEDWILDNILQPFPGEPFSMVDALQSAHGHGLRLLGASPKVFEDWRWYKSVGVEGEAEMLRVLLADIWRKLPSFLDSRTEPVCVEADLSRRLMSLCLNLFNKITSLKEGESIDYIILELEKLKLIFLEMDLSELTCRSIADLIVWLKSADQVLYYESLGEFGSFFGRGQQYLSFVNGSID